MLPTCLLPIPPHVAVFLRIYNTCKLSIANSNYLFSFFFNAKWFAMANPCSATILAHRRVLTAYTVSRGSAVVKLPPSLTGTRPVPSHDPNMVIVICVPYA